jgi:hypothetical protein
MGVGAGSMDPRAFELTWHATEGLDEGRNDCADCLTGGLGEGGLRRKWAGATEVG